MDFNYQSTDLKVFFVFLFLKGNNVCESQIKKIVLNSMFINKKHTNRPSTNYTRNCCKDAFYIIADGNK